MKNIFLLPTDKPSYLFIIDKSKMFVPEAPYLSYTTVGGRVHKTEGSDIYRPQFIYIINDEKIEDGNWVFQECLNMPHRLIKTDTENVKVLNDLNKCKKIVLTNDTSLIEDGVQSIDDEFLEWFVKNPSCEEVEVMNVPDFIYETKHSCYKIIIPKEEPKSLIEKMKTLQEQWQRDMLKTLQEPKQETLEEAKLNEKEFYEYMAKQDSWKSTGLIIQEFIQLKLKEQDKNKYSEKEMLNFAWFLLKNVGQYSDDKTAHFEGKYLEQFKKK